MLQGYCWVICNVHVLTLNPNPNLRQINNCDTYTQLKSNNYLKQSMMHVKIGCTSRAPPPHFKLTVNCSFY